MIKLSKLYIPFTIYGSACLIFLEKYDDNNKLVSYLTFKITGKSLDRLKQIYNKQFDGWMDIRIQTKR